MSSKGSGIFGVILVLAGAALLFRNYIDIDLDLYTLRSFGLLLIGIVGFTFGIQRSSRRGMYLYPLLIFIGLFYTLGELDFYYINRGLSISAWTISLGLAFYPAYFLEKARNLNALIVGNVVLLTGLLFLSYELDLISTRLFVSIFDDYWPVALILVGIGFLFNGLRRSSGRAMTTHEELHHS